MEKSKRRSETLGEEEEDRLSELPDSVIFQIFWFIPMSDVVRTTILSKRWRNLWTTVPFLNFDDDSSTLDEGDPHKFCSFVKQLLFRWNGVRLSKFRVCYAFDSEIDLWVEFAIAKGVEELYLHNTLFESMAYDESDEESCWVPQCVYSCSSLKVLSIGECKLRIDEYVQWNQLKSLTITQGFEVTENVITQILYGSPRLEVLNLSFLDKGQNLNIRSRSLKELSICKHLFVPQDLSLTSELTIWTPNLETLKIEGVPFGKFRSIDVSSSTHVSIGFCGSIYHGGNDCHFSGINTGNHLSFHDFLVEKFYRILPKMRYVGSVALSCCCLEVLGVMEKVRYTFREVRSLKIKYHFNDYEQLRGLGVFPKLNRLVLQDNQHHYNQNEPLELEAKSHFKFSFSPHQLRIVDITWSGGEGIFPFLEFLLRCGSNLENMVFRVKEVKPGSAPTDSLLVASQKLLRMPRSSTNCTVHITPCVFNGN